MTETLKAIRIKIPIRFEKVKVAIKIPGDVEKSIQYHSGIWDNSKEEWQRDGSWIAVVEIPGGYAG